MDPRTARKIISRLQDLERSMPNMRLGVITDTSPLSVALGGSDTPYTDVKAIAGIALAVDDVVSVIRFGADLVILGVLGDGTNYTDSGVAEQSFRAYRSSNQTSGFTTNVAKKVEFNAEDWDTNGVYDAATNYRYTPQVAGAYRLSAAVIALNTDVDQCVASLLLYKNGALEAELDIRSQSGTAIYLRLHGTADVEADGVDDYFEIFLSSSVGSPGVYSTARTQCRFEGELIGKS